MKRLRTSMGALATLAFVTSLLVLAPTPAQADHLVCGVVLTEDTTLDADIGPCTGHGVTIGADNITLNMNGYRIFGDNVAAEQIGVQFLQVNGSAVINGTVEGFDAGVAIEEGGNNRVERMIVRDNVNDLIEPFDPTGPPPEGMTLADVLCFFGDGITTFDSDNNVIQRNWVVGNGPYGGITLVNDSDGNVVNNNRVEDNNIPNTGVTDEEGNPVFVDTRRYLDPPTNSVLNPAFRQHVEAGSPGAGEPTGMCGAVAPGSPGMSRGRTVQDIGIRAEGPGADDNAIQNNLVDNSALVGISVHSYVCQPPPGFETPPQDPNTGNVISRNHVMRTGNETFEDDAFADGIALLAQGPLGVVTCGSDGNTVEKNISVDNRRHGISVNRDNDNNIIRRNMANDNDVDGIIVDARVDDAFGATDNLLRENRGTNNGRFDGSDFNPNCDNNQWINNIFGTVNQECVDPDATVVIPPAPAAAAAGAADAAAEDDLSGMTRASRS